MILKKKKVLLFLQNRLIITVKCAARPRQGVRVAALPSRDPDGGEPVESTLSQHAVHSKGNREYKI